MADSKLADLSAITALGGDELFYVVDDPAGTPVDRKIAADKLVSGDATITKVVKVTQATYDGLTPVATTLYIIVS